MQAGFKWLHVEATSVCRFRCKHPARKLLVLSSGRKEEVRCERSVMWLSCSKNHLSIDPFFSSWQQNKKCQLYLAIVLPQSFYDYFLFTCRRWWKAADFRHFSSAAGLFISFSSQCILVPRSHHSSQVGVCHGNENLTSRPWAGSRSSW